MGDAWWDVMRQRAYAAADMRCQACGIPKWDAKYHQWLEAHETYLYDYRAGFAVFVEIIALCYSCHNFIHDGRLEMLVRDGKITKGKQKDILAHGMAVLRAAGLKKVAPVPSNVAPWAEWCLIFEGVVYPGKFKSYTDWERHYSQ